MTKVACHSIDGRFGVNRGHRIPNLSDTQRHLLAAALDRASCITVTVAPNGDVAVDVRGEPICRRMYPVEGLLHARLVELAEQRDDPDALFRGAKIRSVLLFRLTKAGRALAEQFAIDESIKGRRHAVVDSPPRPTEA